jgi:hypothetical protein
MLWNFKEIASVIASSKIAPSNFLTSENVNFKIAALPIAHGKLHPLSIALMRTVSSIAPSPN